MCVREIGCCIHPDTHKKHYIGDQAGDKKRKLVNDTRKKLNVTTLGSGKKTNWSLLPIPDALCVKTAL